MTSQPPNLLQLAKQGNPQAISILMNRYLQPKGITVKVGLKDGCLQVMLESAQELDQKSLVQFIQKGITNLQIASIKKLTIYGKHTEQEIPIWSQEVLLVSETVKPELRPITPIQSSNDNRLKKLSIGSTFASLKPLANIFNTKNGSMALIGVSIFFGASVIWLGVNSLKPKKYSIQGSLTLIDVNITGPNDQCSGSGGYSDIGSEMPVTIRDNSGKILATGRTGTGLKSNGIECTFVFKVDNIPKSDFYSISVGRRGELNYSFDEMEQQKWVIRLTLGS